VVEDFAERLEQQLDLRKEAQHLVRFRENFDCKGLSVDFPRPLIEGNLSGSPKVLVETFVDKAKPILEFIEDASVTQETKKALSGICLKAIMKMVLLDNMLHGDLHPGNIMVRDLRGSNAESQKVEPAASMFDWLQEKLGLSSASSSTGAGAMAGLEVIFLDAGLSIDLDDYSHKNMVGILRAFTENDGRRAARLAVEASDRSAALEALEKADEERSLFGSLTAGIFGGLGGGSRDKVEEHAAHSQGNNGARGGKGEGGSGGGVAGGSSTTTREDSLEKFYEGCHSVMQQAADSDNLTLELGNHMRNMFGLACDNRVRLEPYFVSVALAVRVMEGIASRLDPDVQLRPFATEIFKQASFALPISRGFVVYTIFSFGVVSVNLPLSFGVEAFISLILFWIVRVTS
jgi:predicted unusual protein kinase regulating ubiquinone biosynthesis (AarF/ABC1/UbiB family)